MQAIIYRRYGPPDVLEYEELDRPIPAPGEVLIQVRAASVNPYDWHFLRGPPSFIRLSPDCDVRNRRTRRCGVT
jgi:NADPH:quinone reductase-like Zn-dependent oxidoreductase